MKIFFHITLFLVILISPPAFAGEKEDFSLAEGAYSDGLYEIAEKQLEKFLVKYPRSREVPMVYFFLAECEFKQGNFSTAREEYALSRKSGKTREKAEYRIGQCFLGEDNLDEAFSSLGKFLHDYPESEFAPAAIYWLAGVLARQDKTDKACEAYARLQEKYPGSPYVEYALLSKGMCLIRMNMLDAAVSSFKTIITKFGDSALVPSAQFWLGQAYISGGKLKEALFCFKKILKVFPQDKYSDDAGYAIGVVLFELGRNEEALQSFGQLLDSFPESQYVDEAGYAIAYIHQVSGKCDEAVVLYQELLDAFPASNVKPPALYNLGLCFMALNKKEEAALSVKNLLDNYPQSEWAGRTRTAVLSRAGNDFFSRGEFARAFEKYRELFDGEFGAEWKETGLFYAGASLFGEGKYKEAIDSFELFIARFPDSRLVSDANSCIGQSLFNLKRYKEAKKCFGSVEDKELSYMKIGDCLSMEGLVQDAIASYDKVRGRFSHEAKFQTGRLFYKEGEFQKASAVFKPLIEAKISLSDDAQYWFAACMYQMKKIEEAEKCFEDFIEKFPGSELLSGAFFNLGNVQYDREAYQEAADTYRNLEKLFPDSVEARESGFKIGVCQLQLGNADDAETLFVEYISCLPRGRWALEAKLWLGRCLYEKKEFDKAEEMILPLTECPEDELKAGAHYWLGRCFEEKEEYDSAIREFNKIIKEFPEDYRTVEVKLRVADLFAMQGEEDKALNVYREIISEPENEFSREARFHMGRTLQKSGKYREAILAFEKTGETGDESQDAELQFRIASCFYKLGEFEEAILGYLKVVYLYPDCFSFVIRATESAAVCFEQLNKVEEAVSLYKKILQADPRGVKGELAREKIEKLIGGGEK